MNATDFSSYVAPTKSVVSDYSRNTYYDGGIAARRKANKKQPMPVFKTKRGKK